ncbi:MAG: glycosyl transferase, partial [bacterium (Candidatus Stahlbacteria) CG23_combo_of_CG06-09_8_20_14_all_40_9]
MNPKVSIIIVNWNGRYFLRECLDSVFRQTYPSYEVIIVDNGSTDDSVKFVLENYPQVKVIKNEKNYGYAKGNNIGIREGSGKYVVTLNNDTEVAKNWLEELVRVAESNSRIGICASKQLNYHNRRIIDAAGCYLTKYAAGKNIGLGEFDCGQYDSLREIFGASGASAFYRKKMLEEIGLFDEDYFLYEEELDLCWRAKLSGWKCIFVPGAIVYHIKSSSVMNSPYRYGYYTQRNRLFNIVKNFSLRTLIAVLPYLLKCEFDNFLDIVFKYNTIRLKARIDFIKLLP